MHFLIPIIRGHIWGHQEFVKLTNILMLKAMEKLFESLRHRHLFLKTISEARSRHAKNPRWRLLFAMFRDIASRYYRRIISPFLPLSGKTSEKLVNLRPRSTASQVPENIGFRLFLFRNNICPSMRRARAGYWRFVADWIGHHHCPLLQVDFTPHRSVHGGELINSDEEWL